MKYTKVIIKSEADLPKKEGFYICGETNKDDSFDSYVLWFDPYCSEDIVGMTEMCDWYLIEDTEHSDCNHVVGAADESGCCIKCGKKVCEIINNNLCQK